MGEARVNEASAKAVAFAKTDMCIFCGGLEMATTVDHCPPRAIFSERKWPEGYVFPACMRCNSGSKESENWIALLSCMHGLDAAETPRIAGEFMRIGRSLLKPAILKEMLLSSSAKRQLTRKIGADLEPGQTFSEFPLVRVPSAATAAVPVFAAKLAKALHFMHTDRVVPNEAAIEHRWFTNYNSAEGKVPEEIFTVPTGAPALRRGKVDLGGQFNYRFGVANNGELSMFTIWFRSSFCMVVMITFDPALMEQVNTEAKRKIES